jgi:HEAT repeat protein
MKRVRALFGLLLLNVIAWQFIQSWPHAPSAMDSCTEVAWAIKELDKPMVAVAAAWGGAIDLPHEYYEACPDAIDFLIETKAPVDDVLLTLAEKNRKRLRIRYRVAYILAARGYGRVEPLLYALCASKDEGERYLGWYAYWRGLAKGKLKAPKLVTKYLDLYAKETNTNVRDETAYFLGYARSKAAVKLLLTTLQRQPDNTPTIAALGKLGDARAVPALIEAYEKGRGDRGACLQALGRIGTPRAVGFVIKHLGEHEAVEGLLDSGSPKAVPALKRHLKNLQQSANRDSHEVAMTRIAIVRLNKKDPREALMKMAEDKREDRDLRWYSLRALQNNDTAGLKRRILGIYVSESNRDMKRICFWLLQDACGKEVTKAMIDHALAIPEVHDKDDDADREYLRKELNKRLGRRFRDMDVLQAHLRRHFGGD